VQPEGEPPAVNPPRQARSRETERAIATALSALLREKPFSDISVAEIAAAARVSVGGFYARFASKDALLAMVELSILEQFDATAAATLDPAQFVGKGIREVAIAYTTLLVTHFRRHRTEIIQILRYTRPRSPTEERLRAFNIGVHDRVRALLAERVADISGDDPMRTINLGLFIASAACRDAVLTRNLEVYPVEVDDDLLSQELGESFFRHLVRTVPA
jgi:AcrR family transcriptional regulator